MLTKGKPKPQALPKRYRPGFMRELDQRSEISRRLNAAYETVVAEAGGAASLTHVKLALIERFCFLEAMLQTWEVQLANTDAAEADAAAERLTGRWTQAVNALQGLAKLIGLERRLANVVDLKDYLKEGRQ